MLITGIDKATNSVCKQRCGYILGHISVFQPMNWIFVKTAKVFPIDYVLMGLLVLHLFSSSISGIATALLIATVMLGLITLAINYAVAMFIAPQYSIFGTQTFCSLESSTPGTAPDCRANPDAVLPCSQSRKYPFANRACTPSVMSDFLNRITITWPFFGIVAFWGQFVFLAIFLVVLVTAIFRTPRVSLAELDEDAEEDEEESLLAATGRRFAASWEDARNNNNNSNNRSYGTANA
ncbi:hypothetical protein NLG97_g10625 [Lecanicillium saksenae]|uniref:Uncharacterized protein n=1 Tax=Lecanicillium saksenae TaxID=468837 RepID=A0ACC1QE34_9HYPO|nr:hypothetical protein NLG97_g10625 [Lecanicillium saksenae]